MGLAMLRVGSLSLSTPPTSKYVVKLENKLKSGKGPKTLSLTADVAWLEVGMGGHGGKGSCSLCGTPPN